MEKKTNFSQHFSQCSSSGAENCSPIGLNPGIPRNPGIAKNNKMTGVKTRGNFENSQKIQFCEFIENLKRSR